MEPTHQVPFLLQTRDDIKIFQKRTHDYLNDRCDFGYLIYIDLLAAHDWLESSSSKDQIFAAILDLKISFNTLAVNQFDVFQAWHSLNQTGLVSTPVLSSQEVFKIRMDIHQSNTALIFLYRAIWDKIMGLLILLTMPASYDTFVAAKSRKKSFVKLAKDIPQIEDAFITQLSEMLTDFDNQFRTPEAHRAGRLRKFSFLPIGVLDYPHLDLLKYWNYLLSILPQIDATFQDGK